MPIIGVRAHSPATTTKANLDPFSRGLNDISGACMDQDADVWQVEEPLPDQLLLGSDTRLS
jgi:hypothetical protein